MRVVNTAMHVGPVRKIGDAAEPFRLALGRIGLAGAVEAHQLGVGRGVELGLDVEHEGAVRRLQDGEAVRRRDEGVGGERCAVDGDRTQHQLVAVEHDRRRRGSLGVRLELELRAHPRAGRLERDVEVDRLHQPVGRTIIGEADGDGLFCAHDFTAESWETCPDLSGLPAIA